MKMPRLLTALLLAALAAAPADGQQTPPPNPYATWRGDATPWPMGQPPALQLRTVPYMMEAQREQEFQIAGPPDIRLASLRPFRIADPVPGASLAFIDERAPGALLLFSVFGKGDFIKTFDANGLMGYAKALVTGAGRDETVSIVDPPDTQIDRRLLFLMQRPLLITSKRVNNKTGAATLRTDWFFDVGDALLVVTAIGPEGVQPALRSDAEEVLRFGRIEAK